MRIALFTETYIPYINGVVTHVNMLRKGLEQLGHQVLVVTANPNAKRYYLKNGVLYCPSVSIKKIYDYGVATPISKIRYSYIKKFNPDVIHIHTEFGVGYSGAVAAKALNVPLIYTLHTMYDDYLYYIVSKPLLRIAKKSAHAYAKSLAERATCLTGPSKKVEEFFRQCSVQKPVYVIPNPVETDLFCPNPKYLAVKSEIRNRFQIAPNDCLLCFCGRLGKEKNVNTLLDYWAQTIRSDEHCQLLIIGDGPARKELQSQADSLGISDQIHFAGKIPHGKLPPYYIASDLYVTASLSDTNSISMLEGMAAGLPVLHISDPLNRGQVVDGVNGYIYRNAAEFHDKLQLYRQLPQTAKKKLSLSARSLVLSSGSQALAEKLLQVYHIAQQKSSKNR